MEVKPYFFFSMDAIKECLSTALNILSLYPMYTSRHYQQSDRQR